jgi:proteasome lid subunit RPN8/RPN11
MTPASGQAARGMERRSSVGSREGDEAVRLTRRVLGAIASHVRDAAPREACGILGSDPDGVVVRAERVANVATDIRRFRFDPTGELAAFEALDADGLEFAGIYHSHPTGRRRPSTEDIEGAELAAARASVIVVPRADGGADVTAFSVGDGEARELQVLVVD